MSGEELNANYEISELALEDITKPCTPVSLNFQFGLDKYNDI